MINRNEDVCMEDFNPDRILSVLEAEDHWLTFDELFSRVHHEIGRASCRERV